jgi:hypothetical protein
LDDTHWPILVVHFNGIADDQEFISFLNHLTAMLSRGERHAVVLNASGAQYTPIAHHRLQAEWLRAHRAELAEQCAGTAFVFTSRLFRVVMTGVFMLQPLPAPVGVFRSLGEGVSWAAAQLGIQPPVSGLTWDTDETTRRAVKPA